MDQHQHITQTMARALKRLFIIHEVEHETLFLADWGLRIDMVAFVAWFHDTSIPTYNHNGLVIDGTFADPQAAMHLRNESAHNNGFSDTTAEGRKNANYAHPNQVTGVEFFHQLGTSGG